MAKRKQEGLNGVADLYLIRQLAERNQPPDDDLFSKQYPKLFSILSDNRISDTQIVDPPILTVRNAAGDWQFSLSVPGLRMYGDILAGTFQDGLQALENALAGQSFGWKVNTKKAAAIRDVKRQK